MPLLKLWNSIRGHSAKAQPIEEAAQPAAKAAKPRKSRSPRGLFGGGPHADLRKLLKKNPATTMLEIGVGDGSRAIAAVESLQQDVRYVAIDQFEMTGGINLKQFHQTLRGRQIRAQLFPQTFEKGLIRVAHTIGTVDLIIISLPTQSWQHPAGLALLSKVSHPTTSILYLDSDQWKSHDAIATPNLRRAA